MRSEGSSKGEFSIEDFVSGRTIRNSFPYRVTNEYDEVRYIAMQGDCPGEYIVNPKDPHHKSLQRVSTFFLSPQEPNLSRLGSAYFQGLRCVNVNQFRGSNLRFSSYTIATLHLSLHLYIEKRGLDFKSLKSKSKFMSSH